MITTIEDVKRQAKRIARATTVSHAQALDVLAVQNGFSHWAAYSRHLELAPVAAGRIKNDDYVSTAPGMQGMLEAMLRCPLPGLAGCRHLMPSGAASTGKTALVNRLMETLPGTMRVVAVDERGDLKLPPGGRMISVASGRPNPAEARAMSDALDMRPDLLVVHELTPDNVVAVLEAMTLEDGPIVICPVHSSSVEGVRMVVRHRADAAGRPDLSLPADVAVMQLRRDMHPGGRVITHIQRG